MPQPSLAIARPFQMFLELRPYDFLTFKEREAVTTEECDARVAQEGEKGPNRLSKS